jgi:hypothetical protein
MEALILLMLAWHTNDHGTQIDYIRARYGDRKWN